MKQVYICPECGEAAFPEEWDTSTIKEYANRSGRRSHVVFVKGFTSSHEYYYKCPVCGKFSPTSKIQKV